MNAQQVLKNMIATELGSLKAFVERSSTIPNGAFYGALSRVSLLKTVEGLLTGEGGINPAEFEKIKMEEGKKAMSHLVVEMNLHGLDPHEVAAAALKELLK